MEGDLPLAGREDRVVAAEADALAGPEAGAALADDDLAAVTCWPAKTLTPSMFGFDSRPFREEPRPFL